MFVLHYSSHIPDSTADIKVRDHCHLTRKCRAPAPNALEIIAKQPTSFLVPFPKLNGHDSHLYCKGLVEKDNKRIRLIEIPKTSDIL